MASVKSKSLRAVTKKRKQNDDANSLQSNDKKKRRALKPLSK